MTNSKHKSKLVLSSLFAAIISVASFIQIPLPGGVPIALQDMLAMLSGMLLGPLYGSLSVAVFLLLGCIGIPVFTGKAGLQVISASPTGGFLVGYLLAAITAAVFLMIFLPNRSISKTSQVKSYIFITISAILATVVLFLCGIVGFIRITNFDFLKTIKAVLLPFIPGNIIKIILMVLLTKKFRPIILEYTE